MPGGGWEPLRACECGKHWERISLSEGLTVAVGTCMVIYMETATATNTNTGETYELKSLGHNMERNIERKFGVRFARHTTDTAAKTVTYTTTTGGSVVLAFG